MKSRHVLIFVALVLVGVLVWGIVAPPLQVALDPAHQLQCATNLKSLSIFAMMCADKTDKNFPHSPNGSIAILQQIVDTFPDRTSSSVGTERRPHLPLSTGG